MRAPRNPSRSFVRVVPHGRQGSRAPLSGARSGRSCNAASARPAGTSGSSAEVMVINELKLNFMEPTAQEILTAHMRDFLALDRAARG